MRDTIDFGIDLGTTNSAIAVVEEDGTVAVIKNNDGWDITPSAVWIPKPGVVHVGRLARDRVQADPENAAAEFKLEMGLADAGRRFAKAGITLTPPQLSAEVLKSLRADAAHHTGSPPDAAAIAVPAMFSPNQNKATLEAATLAGFSAACPLVQEPTAAAFAYGFHDADERAYWMVFDFSRGTFDAAVMSKRDGDPRVLNHVSDPYLGGKLIDWAVAERILAPAAASALGLADFRLDNPAWQANFAKLKGAAEEGKIQLSRRDTIELTVELMVGAGATETFEYTLRRDELDRVAEPFYVRAMNLCRKALADGGLSPDDIDRLLLVGGTTLTPGLRERLGDSRDGLGIALDTSLDPTTVVARGAAIFASTARNKVRNATVDAGAATTAEDRLPEVRARLDDIGEATDLDGAPVPRAVPAAWPDAAVATAPGTARTPSRRMLIALVLATVLLVGVGAYLLWPAPTLDADRLDAAVPTVRDLPGWVAHDGLTGALSVPAGNDQGRSVLTGAKYDEQCGIWRDEGDGWACKDAHGVGMVVLEYEQNVYFRVLSNIIAYDDEDAAVAGWEALVADNRAVIKKELPNEATENRVADVGDENISFKTDHFTAFAIRAGTVVMECLVWDGSDQVSVEEEQAMAQKWPTLQLDKIDDQL